MGLLQGTRRTLLGAGKGYYKKVLGYGPIAYWPLWEASGSVAQCLVNSAQDGAYTGVTLGQPGIGDGNTCLEFDGALDYVVVTSAPLASAFSAAAGGLVLWMKVDAAQWADATVRRQFYAHVNATNYIAIRKSNAANRLQWYYMAGGTAQVITKNSVSSTDWICLGLTWSVADDRMRAFYHGEQEGADQTGLGTWVGSLAETTIGAKDSAPNNPWHKWLAHAILFDYEPTPVQMADLAVV